MGWAGPGHDKDWQGHGLRIRWLNMCWTVHGLGSAGLGLGWAFDGIDMC
jgi:hypothetical protein